ncbi:EexN family lipoprotein [Roseomonas mucosa]|uniref:EexN family lipoprotein n=1 Tax=Roseomonas mucosa TaxID=207340 RepID=UPI00224079F1|nr:EexN family lipoprotein [Roseomonas mucosa]
MVFGILALSIWSTDRANQRNTVSALQADPSRLSRVLEACRNDPGRLADTSRCRNAEAASASAPSHS